MKYLSLLGKRCKSDCVENFNAYEMTNHPVSSFFSLMEVLEAESLNLCDLSLVLPLLYYSWKCPVRIIDLLSWSAKERLGPVQSHLTLRSTKSKYLGETKSLSSLF